MKMHFAIDGQPACGQRTTVHVAGCVTTYRHHVDCARCIAQLSATTKAKSIVENTDKSIKKATRLVNEARAALERAVKFANDNGILTREQIIANYQQDLDDAISALNTLTA